MNEALEQIRRIEEQIRELANDLDWLDEPVGLYGDEDEQFDVGRSRPKAFETEALP